jgi:hypothetical protein
MPGWKQTGLFWPDAGPASGVAGTSRRGQCRCINWNAAVCFVTSLIRQPCLIGPGRDISVSSVGAA